MRPTLVFATNNAHKLQEVSAMLAEKVEILSLHDIGCRDDIQETASTLQDNALLKARFVYSRYHLDCFADDTGLEVEALNGEPGVYTARYAGEPQNSEANMDKLLGILADQSNRVARFRTVFALVLKGKEYLFEGIVNGYITHEKHGTAGFGYDPVFCPQNHHLTFAQMDSELKNRISHRAIAVKKLSQFLSTVF